MAYSVGYSDANWNGAATLLGGAGPKYLRSIHAHSETAGRYVQVFDASAVADVTLGTTEPRLVLPLENIDDSVQRRFEGVKFQLGVVIAATTAARGDTTGGTLNYFVEVA